MAFNQEITDRCKAVGFFKHVEWNRKNGVLIKLFDQPLGDSMQTVSFESGVYDTEYDQYLPGYRVFFVSRQNAVKFMLNMGMAIGEIATTFKLIDNSVVVTKHI